MAFCIHSPSSFSDLAIPSFIFLVVGILETAFRILVLFNININLPACMSLYHVHAQCLQQPEEDVKSSESGVTDGRELQSGCWESNPSLLKQQP